jgi:hypothetical protein
MDQQGDKGIETEMLAFERQGRDKSSSPGEKKSRKPDEKEMRQSVIDS